MTAEEIKKIFTSNFSEFSLSTLEHYYNECEKIIANMIVVDPTIFDIMTRLEDELNKRG